MKKRILSLILAVAMCLSMLPTAAMAADIIYINLDANGVPTATSGTGWSYDGSALTLGNGYSYAVSGAACSVVVNNCGTIVGGIYNNTVNNLGDSDTTYKESIAVITDGTFNGAVINGDGFDICTINGGTFNGNVTNKNRGVINDGTFCGEVTKILGSTFNGGSFVVVFETNGGVWAANYTAPTTYSYADGLTLPTANDISNGSLTFDGWYDNAGLDGLPVTEIPKKTAGKLTFYARFVDGITTWEMAGNTAVENTDYAVDANGSYTVFTAKGLAKIANIVNGGDTLSGKTVTLANDIDLSAAGVKGYGEATVTQRNSWIPISGFAGTFDGNGKNIHNLYVLTENKDAGLFGSNVGTIKDLALASGKVTIQVSSNNELHAGGIAATTSGLIDNCVNRVSVYANDTFGSGIIHIGGIAGLVSTSSGGAAVSTVSNCTNYGTIASLGNSLCEIYGGGIAGYLFSGRITGRKSLVDHCINEGRIDIQPGYSSWAGGIAGSVQSNSNNNTAITATVINSKNTASVGGVHAGGITGYHKNTSYLYNCYNTGNITGGTNAGGIVGLNNSSNSTVANCYNIGTASDAVNNGGIAGRNPNGTLSNCYYLDTTASSAAGYSAGTMTDCVAFATSNGTHTLVSAVNGTTDLLTVLNLWVTAQSSSEYLSWAADAQNNNYPDFLAIPTYTVTVTASPAEGGTVTGGGTYVQGTSVTVTATPNDGYTFTAWKNGDTQVSTSASYTFTAADCNLTAYFAAKSQESTPAATFHPATGKLIGLTPGAQYRITVTGTDSVYTADADGAISADSAWYGNSIGIVKIASDGTHTDSAPQTLAIPVQNTVTVTNGSGSGSYFTGMSVTIEAAQPETGKQFKEWIGTDGLTFTSGGTTSSTATFTMPANTVSVTATYEDIPAPPVSIPEAHRISTTQTEGGSVTANVSYAYPGETVTLTVVPDSRYELISLKVTNGYLTDYRVSGWGNTYTFTMPENDVVVTAYFEKYLAPNTYSDVKAGTYYYDAVCWALGENVVQNTTGKFGSDVVCTRAEMVEYIWRAVGCPSPRGTVQFTDVPANASYAQAVQWAVEQGITTGTTATTFSPNQTVTRAQAMTFLWRYAGQPRLVGGSFSDVPADAYYAYAVRWAVQANITTGTTYTTFSPNQGCTRAQIMTFLYRWFGR